MPSSAIAKNPLPGLIKAHQGHQTPCYAYDLDLLEATIDKAREAAAAQDIYIHYAVKANWNTPILERMRKAGLGADCVSGNEVQCALDHGFHPDSICFAGVGKTDWELEMALKAGIGSFNCESLEELEVLNALAANLGFTARVALRLNPDVEAGTHRYISTGKANSKFGIGTRELEILLKQLPTYANIQCIGFHLHVGSQITDMAVFRNLALRAGELYHHLEAAGISIDWINLGGGLGIHYQDPDTFPIPDFESYFSTLRANLAVPRQVQVAVELGRSLVGQCGSLLTKVLYIKQGAHGSMAIVDAGMTELLRPALYEAYHKPDHLTIHSAQTHVYDLAGPVCESSDVFARGVEMPLLKRGNIIAFRSCGAYAQAMRMTYNLRNNSKELYYRGSC